MSILQEVLNVPQFIKYLNDSQVNQKFVTILKTSGSLSRPNAFKFEPDLYAHLINFNTSSIKDLVTHYYNIGVDQYPICARYVINKLFPDLEYDKQSFQITSAPGTINKYTTLAELINAELYDKPAPALLDWFLENHFSVMNSSVIAHNKFNHKLIIHVHIGNLDIGKRILTSIMYMLSFDNLANKCLIFITQSTDYTHEIVEVLKQSINQLNYIIASSVDLGTDIQAYFLSLYYLTKHYPTVGTGVPLTADYILKLHTKSDIQTMNQMLDAFSGAKLASAISHLDNPASSNIDIIGAQPLIMPNYHVKDLLTKTYPLSPIQDHNKFVFVAGSSFLSRFKLQLDILAKYTPTLIKQSLFSGQYYTGWLFDKNSPAHALERVIGGFESQANGNHIASI